MGGDGTMLGAARQLAYSSVPLIGINHGRLGFITDIPLHSANDALASVIHGNYEAEDRVLLEGRVLREGETLFSGLALNDRSEEHTSELQSLMRISYAVFCLKKKKK